jgi:hypothetical protein
MNRKRLLAAAVVVVTFCIAVGSAGGRSTGTSASVVLSPLIGTDANGVQQVTFGGKMGFHLEVANTGTSTFNHLVIVVDSGPGTSFSDSSQPSSVCAKDPNDATRMVCKLVQMKGGAPPFTVDLRFNAPASGSTVDTVPSLTVDAQTQGDPGNNGTQTVTGNTVTTALVSGAGNSLVKTFARGKESIATAATLPQHSKVTMPDFGSLFGVDTSLQDTTTDALHPPLCAFCPTFVTILEIPASLGANSPFSATNPFMFTVTLLPSGVPKKYTPTGLYHDGVKVPMCADSPLSANTHMCLDSFNTSNIKKNGIVAVGEADQNGRLGFG